MRGSGRNIRWPGAAPLRVAAVRLLLFACLSCIGFPFQPSTARGQENPTPNQKPTREPAMEAAAALEATLIQAIAKAEKSVVAIARIRKEAQPPAVADDAGLRSRLEGLDFSPDVTRPDFVPHDFATGVVVDAKGLILTNYHVLGDREHSEYMVWVQRKPYRAVVKAADSWLDLAVLKIEATDLTPVTWGNARNLKKGQIVLSLGNPYAIARDGEASATWGIISNLSRQAPPPAREPHPTEGKETLHHYGTLIHTDAKLELGTSGGALVNLQGEMVGLTTSLAALLGYEKSGGFAIPVDDDFRKALETLKAGRMPEYGFLGVAPAILTLEERQRGRYGARIVDVVPATPAAQAGLLPGDIVTAVNDLKVADDVELIRRLSGAPAGSEVALQVERGAHLGRPGKPLLLKVQLSKKRVDPSRPGYAEVADAPWRGMKVEYSTAAPSFRERNRDLDPLGSVAVVDVRRDSPAWNAGLRTGDFVSHVGQSRVTSPKEFYRAALAQRGLVDLRLTAAADKAPRTVAAEAVSTP